jgi:hypothetical protein
MKHAILWAYHFRQNTIQLMIESVLFLYRNGFRRCKSVWSHLSSVTWTSNDSTGLYVAKCLLGWTVAWDPCQHKWPGITSTSDGPCVKPLPWWASSLSHEDCLQSISSPQRYKSFVRHVNLVTKLCPPIEDNESTVRCVPGGYIYNCSASCFMHDRQLCMLY